MKKSTRGLISYAIMLGVLLLIAVMLNNSMPQAVSKRIEYPELLQVIENGQVSAVAVRDNSLVGLKKNSAVSANAFPEQDYDFETTIGSDFLMTARQMTASKKGVALESISVHDLPFTLEYRAPEARSWWVDYLPFLGYMGPMFLYAALPSVLWYATPLKGEARATYPRLDTSAHVIKYYIIVAVTLVTVFAMLMSPQLPFRPLPMPAASLPPVAVT